MVPIWHLDKGHVNVLGLIALDMKRNSKENQFLQILKIESTQNVYTSFIMIIQFQKFDKHSKSKSINLNILAKIKFILFQK